MPRTLSTSIKRVEEKLQEELTKEGRYPIFIHFKYQGRILSFAELSHNGLFINRRLRHHPSEYIQRAYHEISHNLAKDHIKFEEAEL